jgi:TolB-like protein
MQGEPPTKASTPTGAVFLSYASQDAGAAQRICEALRAAGIEVWFDQSELRGGDAWDHKIRDQIHDCRLFVPVISANTERRDEGYFRREWSLAVDRTRDMVHKRTFLVPVVIDGTLERGAAVPDKFHELQWTRLPGGETPPAFVERVRQLLAPDVSPAQAATTRAGSTTTPISPTPRPHPWRSKVGAWTTGAVLAVALAYIAVDKLWVSRHLPPTPPAAPPPQTPATATAAAFTPPPHSIAVLPFTNLSGDPKQEYLSDGISEELINALSHIDALQVAARTSSFSFKGKQVDIDTIARKLGVGAVLEGSVRRSGNNVRITVQLINAVTGFHIWSENYDRDVKNLLAVQTDIATTAAKQLRATLLGDEAAKIEAGGTSNPQAYDAYLRGLQMYLGSGPSADEAPVRAALASYDQAISLDPNYAAPYAQRARALSGLARRVNGPRWLQRRESLFQQARQSAERAVALAPDFADGHVALGWHVLLYGYLDFQGAAREIERAMSLASGSAYVLRTYASFQGWVLGRRDTSLAAIHRAVSLDPQNYFYRLDLLAILRASRLFTDVLTEAPGATALRPDSHDVSSYEAEAFLAMGEPQRALQLCGSQSAPLDDDDRRSCLAMAYHALGKIRESEIEFVRLQALKGETEPAVYAAIYAQLGKPAEALRWLATAERLRDTNLVSLKTDWRLDPIRNQREFKALERRLNYPP